MDSSALGKRIKEARLAKKMTQSEVVGSFITRNMLSQIESGSATPSVRTLEYLCSILDLPIDQLIGEPVDDALSMLTRAKKLLAQGKNQEVIQMDGAFPQELEDEFDAIFAKAYLERAKELEKLAKTAGQAGREKEWREKKLQEVSELVEAEGLREAAEMAKRSIEYAQLGVYANSGLRTDGLLLLNRVAEELGKYYLLFTQKEEAK